MSSLSDALSKTEMFGAPFAELRFGNIVRTYERIKLVLMLVVLLIDLAIGGYLVTLAKTNQDTLGNTRHALIILECAVDHRTSTQPNGVARTHADAQRVFDACVRAGGPKGTPSR